MKFTSQSIKFSENLKNKVNSEPSIWFLTPKIFNNKPFTGNIDDTKFDLSLNSFFSSFKHIRIKGKYEKISGDSYLVNYNVYLVKSSKIFTFSIILIAFIIVNILAFKEKNNFEILPNVAITAILLWYLLITSILKRISKKRFEKEFNLFKN